VSTLLSAGGHKGGNVERFEKETIINWNQEDNKAYIFTYDKGFQQHMKKLGCKPVGNNRHGAKSYEIPKNWVPLPRKKRKVTEAMRKGLEKARNARLTPESVVATRKSWKKTAKK